MSKTRGRPTLVDQLPSDIRLQLDQALRTRKITQIEILEWLREKQQAGEIDQAPSKSGLNRHASALAQFAAHHRESIEIAEGWVSQIGTLPSGALGDAVIEMIRSMAFDHVRDAATSGEQLPIKQLREVVQIVAAVEKADSERFRREAKAQANAQAAEVAAASARNSGLSPEAVEAIKREILGI